MSKICVILPIYNQEKYLQKSLNTLLSQTLTDWVAICINDGSTDNTLNILQEYANSDPRFILVNQQNKGYPLTINVGIEEALKQNSEFIGFLDPDDYISENYYQTLYDLAKENDANIAATCNVEQVNENYEFINNKNMGCNKGILTTPEEKSKIFTATGALWNKIYQTEFIKSNNIKFIIKDATYCDNSMTIKSAILANKIAVTNKATYYYLQLSNSHSRFLRANDLEVIEYYNDIQNDLSKYNLNEEDKLCYENALNSRMFDEFRRRFNKIEDKKTKRDFIKRAEKLCPNVHFKEKISNKWKESIFSIKNNGNRKILTILGLKIKFKRK